MTHLKGNSSGSLRTPPPNTQHQHPEKKFFQACGSQDLEESCTYKTALFPSITKPCKLASSGWRSGPALPVLPRFLAPSFSSADSGLCHARSLGEPGPGLGSCRRTASERTPGLCSDCGFSAPLPGARDTRSPRRPVLREAQTPTWIPFQGKESISPFQAGAGGPEQHPRPAPPREMAAPSPTLLGQRNLPFNLGALTAFPARTDGAMDHLNFRAE